MVPSQPVSACRDLKDNAVLEAACAAGADCIVSGDRDLLDLGEYRSIPILTPRQFADLLGIEH